MLLKKKESTTLLQHRINPCEINQFPKQLAGHLLDFYIILLWFKNHIKIGSHEKSERSWVTAFQSWHVGPSFDQLVPWEIYKIQYIYPGYMI